MYKDILIPVDNSKHSNYCIEMGVAIAGKTGAQLTGNHIYSERLHDKRFRDMEAGLPGHYQQEERLQESRKVHGSLIGKGLRLISDAYLDVFEKRCVEAGVSCSRKLIEGKNWFQIVQDVRDSRYDLLIMGILGLGAVNGDLIGSVCERVVRRVDTDVLVVKNNSSLAGRIVVGIDGSTHSFAALDKALEFGEHFDLKVEAVAVYDPHFHSKAFQGLAGVLSEEAGKMFKFKEQEKLHDEVIDSGLGKIYKGYLDQAAKVGEKKGVEIKTTLLAGKSYHEIQKFLQADPPSLLIISRFGAHQAEEAVIGNTTANLLHLAPCNMLITS